jgi:Cu(I)-responsive transcriptional regulator
MGALTIGRLAKATGTAVETIRYYEKIGLLPPPPRTEGNYRSYGNAELQRLSFIRRSRDLGFSIEQVRALLSLADVKERSCADVDHLARAQLETVEQKIADLTALRDELCDLLDHCRRDTIASCRIIERLQPATR